MVDGIPRPRGVTDRRKFGLDRQFERPMLRPDSSVAHPAFENIDLFGGQLFARIRRRHHYVKITRNNPANELAIVHVAFDDHSRLGGLFLIESQLCFASARIGAMTVEAFVGQNGPHIAVEVDAPNTFVCRRRDASREHEQKATKNLSIIKRHIGRRAGRGVGMQRRVVYYSHRRA